MQEIENTRCVPFEVEKSDEHGRHGDDGAYPRQPHIIYKSQWLGRNS